MSIKFLLKNEVRTRIVLSFSILVSLISLAVITFPPGSRARRALPQESVIERKRTRPAFVPGEVLVRYRSESLAKNSSGTRAVQTSEGTVLAMQIERFEGSDIVEGLRLAHVAAEDTMKAISALKQQPDVLYAEPNYILHADLNPNDPRFLSNELTNLNRIGAPNAWNTTTGSSSIVVGVIDEGIDINHEDLQPNIWTNPSPGSFPPITGDLHGVNFINNTGNVFSGDPTEDHATHVAGIIGAKGNNGIGVVGVNWTVGLMSLKFLGSDGSGNTADAIRACGYAKQMRDLWISSGGAQGANVRVLNNSYGGGGFTQSFLDAINATNTSGILFVAAAGNLDSDNPQVDNDILPHYPSSYDAPNVIAVGSTNSSESLSWFSHYGANSVDLGAPGGDLHESILSTTPANTYQGFAGTSMATPHVSGAAALIWAQNPSLTVQQVKNLLLLDGDVQGALIDKTITGRRLNVANSLQSLAENDTTPPGTVVGLHVDNQTGRRIDVRWTASGDDGAAGQASLYQLSFTDATTGALIPLRSTLPATSGSLQGVVFRIPFRHTNGTVTLREFDNAGNEGTPATLLVSVPANIGDPYVTSLSANVPLSTGGSRVFGAPGDDDKLSDYVLPFSFPFFGENFSSLHISTNGNLYFSPPPIRSGGDADDVPSSTVVLPTFKMISGLWDDLYLGSDKRSDAGVYVVQPSSDRIIFRWQGVPCNAGPPNGACLFGGGPVNFEIELRQDGTIKSRYGSGNTALFPVVGIAGGQRDAYVISSHTSEDTAINLTNAAEVTYSMLSPFPPSLQFSQSSYSVNEGAGHLDVTVTRGDTAGAATVNYATSDTAGLAGCNVNSGKASERCDYATTVGTLRFVPGEASKIFTIPIIDDTFIEGNETFTVTLSDATGTSLGSPSTATITILENDSPSPFTQNPIDGVQFFVTQQYIDFLGRLPDQTGLANWMATLNGCPNGGFGEFANPGCDRVHVSAGFFQSAEFQGRGYWAYLFYEVALDRRPLYAEFVPDMAQVGGPQSPASEALSKAAYTDAYVLRTEFMNRYAGSSNTAYVNALETNAEVTVTNKQALIDALEAGTTTRALVLRNIVESPAVNNHFFNRAFVAMQYFGYLRRDPDTTGYNNWVTTLTNNPSDYRHMIFGFLFSPEYRSRFGPQ